MPYVESVTGLCQLIRFYLYAGLLQLVVERVPLSLNLIETCLLQNSKSTPLVSTKDGTRHSYCFSMRDRSTHMSSGTKLFVSLLTPKHCKKREESETTLDGTEYSL